MRKTLIIDTLRNLTGQISISAATPLDSTNLNDIETWESSSSHHAIDLGQRRMLDHLSTNTNSDHFPNVIMPLTLSPSATDLELPLDDSGGHLLLKGVFVSTIDTIRINRLSVYHNCLPDTFKMGVTWYRNKNDTAITIKAIRNKTYEPRVIHKPCVSNYPILDSLILNGKKYNFQVNVVAVSANEAWYCHGHKNRFGKWSERRYERRKDLGKPYTYFSGYTKTIKSGLSAEVNIK